MSSDYYKDIKKIIEDKTGLEPSEITLDSYFEDDLNLGEMELIEILSELEEKFNTDLMEQRENIETVQDLVDLLSEQVE